MEHSSINQEVEPSRSHQMAQKMQISDFSVNKYNFSKFFVDSREKSLGSVLFSRDGRVTANIYTFFWPTTKFILNRYLLAQINNRKLRTRCEIYSKLTI